MLANLSHLSLPLSWAFHPPGNFQLREEKLFYATYLSASELGTRNDWGSFIASELIHPRSNPLLLRGCLKDLRNVLENCGWKSLQLGISASIRFDDFLPSESLLELFRRGERKLEAVELSLKSARHAREIVWAESPYAQCERFRHLFRDLEMPGQRYFAATYLGNPIALISLSRSNHRTWHVEQMIRSRKAPSGAMDYLIFWIISRLQDEDYEALNLGEVPFLCWAEIRDVLLREDAPAQVSERFIRAVRAWIDLGFSPSTLFHFKRKYATSITPVYWCGYPSISFVDLLILGFHSNALSMSKLLRTVGKTVKPLL